MVTMHQLTTIGDQCISNNHMSRTTIYISVFEAKFSELKHKCLHDANTEPHMTHTQTST